MSILPLAVAGGIGYLIGKRPRSYSHYRSNIPSTIDNIICQKLNYMFLGKETKALSPHRPWEHNHKEIKLDDLWGGEYNYKNTDGHLPCFNDWSWSMTDSDETEEDKENDESETDC